jgi:hypothetical protein
MMPIDPSDAPNAAIASVQQSMTERAAGRSFATSSLRNADINTLAYSMPHRVDYLPLGAIRRGNNLRQVTRPAGWRFLIHGQGEAIAAARVVMSEAEKYELGELSEGPFVSGTEKVIRDAENLEQVRNGHFEAVLLIAPDIHVAALWLQDRVGDADIVLPIPPTSSMLVPNQPMTPAAFIDVLYGIAEKLRPR